MVTTAYLQKAYSGKKVFLTGHTGFKGTWLLQILHNAGAIVKGYSLAPEKADDLYNQINGDSLCTSVIGDICAAEKLKKELLDFQPDYVIHFAAQALVKRGYDQPLYTFLANAQGTAHVLDAMRFLDKKCVGLMITTDKVYDNPERGLPFSEDDKLGGYDPYSASKASAEIVIDSYRRSFFNPAQYEKHQKSIAAARAGNVIGGGDYSDDRIIPDMVRSLAQHVNTIVRNPKSIRPWQHVLEPLGAYLLLAGKLYDSPTQYCSAFNLGPNPGDMLTVEELVNIFFKCYGRGQFETQINPNAPHEAKLLLLDSTKAKDELGWVPKMDARTAIEWTANWYADDSKSAHEKCISQINSYFS